MTKTLCITGASRGIGKATADVFIEQGWAVINLSRHRCERPGVKNIIADLSLPDWDRGELLQLFHTPEKICLVHNAALHDSDTIKTVAAEKLAKALQVNVIAPTQLNQLLLDKMMPGSSILYMGSTLSEKAVPGCASYITSKHAVAGLMKATCQDLAGDGIHSCCICPGFTNTEMLRDHMGNDPEVLNMIRARVGANRLIEPSEIAAFIYFCANNPMMNGEVFHTHLGQIER